MNAVPATNSVGANTGFRNRLMTGASNVGTSVWSALSSNLFYGGLVVFFLVGIYLYWHYIGYEINTSYTSLVDMISKRKEGSIGLDTDRNGTPEMGVTATLPQQNKIPKDQLPAGVPGSREAPAVTSLGLQNNLFPARKEVFNVSRNIYTFEDATPVCKALGAELASFEQVQEAQKAGADWCNYGWVKGQMAVYPTQKETWNKLQNGPPDQKGACGQPGVNGGYFDNPEMRFGVNCYGVKPDQSANDERLLMENGTIPKTATTLKVDQQIAEIKNNIDMIGILPFSSSKWAA